MFEGFDLRFVLASLRSRVHSGSITARHRGFDR